MSRPFGGIGNRQADKARVFIIFGVVLFVVSSLVFFLSLSSGSTEASVSAAPEQPKEAPVKMVEVLVPVQNVDASAPLEPSMFRKESRPQVGVSPRVVRDFEEIQGQYARSLIVAGQPLHRDLMTSVKPINAITANIPEGYRAVTISVDARSSVEGFARPGARVDVAWVSSVRGQPTVTVIVQNARVLSAERNIDSAQQPGAPVPSTVTLLVTVQDAQKIQLAQSTGSLTLQLRGDGDKGIGSAAGTTTTNMLLAGPGEGAQTSDCTGTVTMGGIKYCVKSNGSLEVADTK